MSIPGWHALRYSEGRALSAAPRPSEYLRACHPNGREFEQVILARTLTIPGTRPGGFRGKAEGRGRGQPNDPRHKAGGFPARAHDRSIEASLTIPGTRP